MSLGEIDTLNLLTDKLNALFDESQGYYETFLDTNKLYKDGKISEKEFFQKLGDYVVAYSALEFLSIKVIFELKKVLDKTSGGLATGATQSPGLMPGMMGGGMGTMPSGQAAPRAGTSQNPVGVPPSVVSSNEAFGEPGTLPTPDPALMPRSSSMIPNCVSCGNELRSGAKFCTKCGTKV